MKPHKDLREQSAFVFTLLNRPNPHMLYCAARFTPNTSSSVHIVVEDTDPSLMSGSATPAEE